jgi:hypothetical protein
LSDRPVYGIGQAKLSEGCDDGGCAYRVELDTRQGVIPLNSIWIGNKSVQVEKVARINAFLADDLPRLALESTASELAFTLVPTCAIVVIGVLLVLRARGDMRHLG